jgi:hypothetical protein
MNCKSLIELSPEWQMVPQMFQAHRIQGLAGLMDKLG